MSILAVTSRGLLAASCLIQGGSDAVLNLRAWINTAGPYGESWELLIPESENVTLEVRYLRHPMGKMSGEFCISSEQLEPIRQAVASEKFMDLPSEVLPEQSHFHKPTLRLRVGLGKRQHEVELYDPDKLAHDPRAQRFLRVWNEVFSIVPLKPGWALQ